MKFVSLAFLATTLLCARVGAEAIALEACLQEVFSNNPDIAATRADLERAAGQRLVFTARGLPRLRSDAALGYQGSRGPGRRATEIVVGHVDLAQPLFDAGIPASHRRGDLEVVIARQNYYQVATERLYAARLQFLQILARRQAAEVLRGIQSALITNQSVQDDLLRAGLVSRLAQLQASVQRFGLEPDLAEAAGSERRGLVALRQLMGRGAGAPMPDPRGSFAVPSGNLDLRALTAEALARRPDLAALRAMIGASQEDQRIVQAAYYPLIEARVGGTGVPPQNKARSSANPNALRSIDSNMVNEFRYGVFLAWVIDNGIVTGQSRSVAATTDGLRITLARAEADVPRDLARIQSILSATTRQRASYAVAGSAGEATLRTVSDQVRAGTASQVAFINAETSALDARLGAVSAAADQAYAFAELDRVTGRYLRFVLPPARDARPGGTK